MIKNVLLILISVFSFSSVGAKDLNYQEKSIEKYNEHEFTLTKKEIKHFLFFPYVKETKLTHIKINGEVGNSSVEEQLCYIKNIIEDKDKTILEHGNINVGYSISIHKDLKNQQFVSINYKELSKLEYIDYIHNKIHIPHLMTHNIVFPIVSEQLTSKWENSNGISYILQYKGNFNKNENMSSLTE